MQPSHTPLRVALGVLTLLLMLGVLPAAAGAQYGGVSGLFVTTSSTDPGVADFTGLGCAGGVEVVLYFPGIQATAADPGSTQTVPGRIVAVTTSVVSADPLQNGTFSFLGVTLPTDLEPGVYEVRARCDSVDLRVLVQLTSDGSIIIDPDIDAPVINSDPGRIPDALPFTGQQSSRLISFAAGLVALGLSLAALSRRGTLDFSLRAQRF